MTNLELTKDIVIAMINNNFFSVSDNYSTDVANACETIYNKLEELRLK